MQCAVHIKKILDKEQIDVSICACDDAFLNPVSKRENYAELLQKIVSYADFYVASSEQVMGYAAVYANDYHTKVAYLTLIAVNPEFQRKNIGALLLEQCEKTALKKGFERMRLQVKNNNNSAIQFYMKRGYQKASIADQNSFYMEKRLVK